MKKMIYQSIWTIICLTVAFVHSELIINVRLNQPSDKNFEVLDENGLSVQNFAVVGDEADSIGFLR